MFELTLSIKPIKNYLHFSLVFACHVIAMFSHECKNSLID